MKWYAAVFAVKMLAIFAFAADAQSPASGTPKFPDLKASNLESREFNLPQDFAGERNLVLVAFQREQQEQLDTWLKEMKRFQEADPGFQYYELPTIERLNSFMR